MSAGARSAPSSGSAASSWIQRCVICSGRRTSRTSAGWPGAACPAVSSTTSTAGRRTSAACRRNVEAFGRLEFRPRVLRDVGTVDTSTSLLGRPLPLPLVLAPTGFTRIAGPEGELAVARAAARAGLPVHPLDAGHPLDRGGRRLQRRARSGSRSTSGAIAAWSGDARAGGGGRIRGHRHHRRCRRPRPARARRPPRVPAAARDRSSARSSTAPSTRAGRGDFVRSEPITFANVDPFATGAATTEAVTLADYINAQFDPGLQWKDLDWFRSIWKGPIVLKGIQTVDDAVLAARAGVEAIALSNHGGRQLDGAAATVELLGPVADAVGDRVELLCDGGVRRGSDIVKAVALGARACMIGRPYLYGYGRGRRAGCRPRTRPARRRRPPDHGPHRVRQPRRSRPRAGVLAYCLIH